ncbi:MAG TPA: VOC family protein [Devosiaceae bacterium]|nr:VOC family protein [Devosiaceae bacterium]
MFDERLATIMLPASDVERARHWYEEKLGLVPNETAAAGFAYQLGGGARMFLYRSDFAGTAKHTLISFACPDIKADVAELRERGVIFIEYDLPQLKTLDGVADFGAIKNAWTKDSEGNILGFVQGM